MESSLAPPFPSSHLLTSASASTREPAERRCSILLAGDPNAWALSINNRRNILGYSFVFGATERIGVWDQTGVFTPRFVEGTPQIPTVSNRLVFNDNNVIVISNISTGDPASYIVPRPGVRLDLADLVENLPAGQNLASTIGINNHGNMIGYGQQGSFLLLRVVR
jgi:hypothetical protein